VAQNRATLVRIQLYEPNTQDFAPRQVSSVMSAVPARTRTGAPAVRAHPRRTEPHRGRLRPSTDVAAWPLTAAPGRGMLESRTG